MNLLAAHYTPGSPGNLGFTQDPDAVVFDPDQGGFVSEPQYEYHFAVVSSLSASGAAGGSSPAVPEPASLSLIAAGALAVRAGSRLRRQAR